MNLVMGAKVGAVLVVIGCAAALVSAAALWMGRWGLAAAAHLLGAAASVLGAMVAIARCEPNAGELRKLLVLLAPLALIVPLGALGTGLAVYVGFGYPRVAHRDPLITVRIPHLPFKPLDIDTGLSFANGGMYDVLRHSIDVDKRLKAVAATTRLRDVDAVPLLKLAMRDAVDDVRLLAYSIKDQIENRINATIREHKALLEAGDGSNPDLHRILAFAYWEMVYLDLVEGSLRDFMLDQAAHHAHCCLSAKRDAAVGMLLGRALLAKGSLDAALEAFEDSMAAGLDPRSVASYQAEIAYLKGDFEDVRRYLERIPANVRSRSPFREVCERWQVAAT